MVLDEMDWRLINEWQRELPLVTHPFKVIAQELGLNEPDVLERLNGLLQEGAVSRVGATCRPNTMGASTLAAICAPEDRLEEVAAVIGEEDGVNHSYQRENAWNLWFVATGPTRKFVNAALERIERRTGLQVLDLRLRRPFNIDLGFALDGTSARPVPRKFDNNIKLQDGDRQIVQALSDGLQVVSNPYEVLAQKLGRTELDVLDRIRELVQSGILSRLGLIVRHRPLGWRSNAMCVFDIPSDDISELGPALSDMPGVTLCYERRPEPNVWPYTLYCMIHGRSRSEALDALSYARVHAKLTGYKYEVLFSTRCFKQRGALVATAQANL